MVRRGLATLLVPRNGMEVVGEAATGTEAVALARTLQPDVILMDLIMPEMDGARPLSDQAGEPRRPYPGLDKFRREREVAAAVRAGALGYLLKDSSPDDLLYAVRSVFRGNLLIPGTWPKNLCWARTPAGRRRHRSLYGA